MKGLLPRLILAIGSVSLALTLGSCGSTTVATDDVDAICVRSTDHVRLPDSDCDRGGSNVLLWYLLAGQIAPRYNQPALYGSSTLPPNTTVKRNRIPATGGAAPKTTTTTKVAKRPTTSGGGVKAPTTGAKTTTKKTTTTKSATKH